jgi:hypothetical protein
MMGEQDFHALVLEYKRSGRGLDVIMERLAARLYAFPGRYGFESQDDAAEALFKYGKRLARLIDRFEDRGSSFDAYLSTSLRYLARTIKRERRKEALREMVCEGAQVSFDLGERMDSPEHPEESPPAEMPSGLSRCHASAQEGAFKSRLVYLYLKCAWEVDESMTDRVSALSGIEPGKLVAAAAQARRSLEAERQRFERMSLRRNSSWCRLRLIEARIREEPDGERVRRLRALLERERARYQRARRELEAFKPVVPNSVVARILGIPKGTVDSGLYYLKKKTLRQAD